jgi:hypothetical protein
MSAMARPQRVVESAEPGAAARNRRTVRVLVAIMLVLVAATILAGIRW